MSVIALDLRGLPKDRAALSVRYANGLGEQLLNLGHEVHLVYRRPYQLDLVGALARSTKQIRLSTGLSFVNNRVLNRAGIELLYSPTARVNRLGGKFKIITTELRAMTGGERPGYLSRPNGDRVIVRSVEASKFLVEQKMVTSQPSTIFPSTSLDALNAQTRVEPAERVLLYAGSWLRDKRIAYLAETLSVLGDFELVVTPKLSPAATRRISAMFETLNARVRFAQLDSNQGLQKLISNSFAVVQTEVPDFHGLVPADVMALAIPMILTDEPQMQELAGATGTFFDPAEPLSLASKVRSLQHQGAWMRASEISRKRSDQQTWARSSQKLERLIQELLS